MAVSSSQLAVLSWRLAVLSWQFSVGSWQLTVGSWGLLREAAGGAVARERDPTGTLCFVRCLIQRRRRPATAPRAIRASVASDTASPAL